MADLLQTLITAIAVGSLYALIALGYTMVYGILKFINFAHSDIVVLGAASSCILSVFLIPKLGLTPGDVPWWLGAIVCIHAMLLCGILGFFIERFAYRPLRSAPRLNVLITAIGVSLFLQNAGQLPTVRLADNLTVPFGPSPRRMPDLLPAQASLATFEFLDAEGNTERVVITLIDTVIVLSAMALMIGLEILVFRTRIGTAMRAVSFHVQNAALMGVPADRVISFTFVLGAMLAAAAGFLYALKYPGLNQPAHETWVLIGLKAFVAAVVGGIGNVRGAVLGGFLIAFIEFFGMKYIDTDLRDVYVFAALILMLLLKPGGLLGSTVREKV